MKVKVIKEFVDKHTGELHKENSTFQCEESRYKEILRSGKYVVPIEEKQTKKSNNNEE